MVLSGLATSLLDQAAVLRLIVDRGRLSSGSSLTFPVLLDRATFTRADRDFLDDVSRRLNYDEDAHGDDGDDAREGPRGGAGRRSDMTGASAAVEQDYPLVVHRTDTHRPDKRARDEDEGTNARNQPPKRQRGHPEPVGAPM